VGDLWLVGQELASVGLLRSTGEKEGDKRAKLAHAEAVRAYSACVLLRVEHCRRRRALGSHRRIRRNTPCMGSRFGFVSAHPAWTHKMGTLVRLVTLRRWKALARVWKS
jgi:hypothetical protein